ncbi:polyketide synthase family protein [Desulfocapsa sulfexigens DSM 10523]|uniref:Polyketide synthase family protein n=1 Tax=Desulfocapsa sulfexigens (strain DSM 10523 / SB164P1) TaxID=1167006 RepID=M1NFV4_DESSD|nr:type I polyketide synthase [Desulfocapsa sulfexigens]AGF78524.1 polyketide synthase family protein [Desulfocapsa sulfexigens DSM 10523]
MSNELTTKSLSYVWHPQYFTPPVSQLVQKNRLQIILDVSELSVDQLTHDTPDLQGVELKLSLEQFFSTKVTALLEAIQTKTIWVEYFPQVSSRAFDAFLEQIAIHDSLTCNIITGDLPVIHACFENPSQVSGLAIKGSESSGFVSSETLLTLLSHLEVLSKKHSSTPAIHVWGGIATPEGAAACLASGVSRIVFESLHWLTDKMVGPNAPLSKKISQLRIDHTSSIELGKNLFFRVFDKGNASAVKELRQLLNNKDGDTTPSSALTTAISSKTVLPLDSDFDGSQLVPLGPEAAFADSFIKRFGQETSTAISNFASETARLYADVDRAIPEMLKGKLTGVLGVQYPFIQGAMACISDVPEFALSIAQAGGLPTIALGIKSIKEIEQDLATLKQTLQGHPYAINVITLPENPYRTEQLAWLEKNKPPFVVISAGDPAHAARLQQKGITVIYVTSDIELLRLAWNNNISIVICEGQEAGGHVGVHSTLTLAQAALELRHQSTDTNSGNFLVLAGGIYNTNSLARAAFLGADGVQMGTLYLSSREIVASGALSKLYQQTLLKSSFGDTILTGESVGLRVRSLSSPKTTKIRSLEKAIHKQTSNEAAIRRQLEETSIGSLLVAARNQHPKSGHPLSPDVCYQEGQYMSGSIAGDLQEILPVAKIHQLLAENQFKAILQNSSAQETSLPSSNRKNVRERIAITGMAAANSLGNSPEEIWQACLAKKSGISEIPAEKWDHRDIFKENSSTKGKTYCKVGAFLSLNIARKELGIPPHDFRTMTASTKLTLWLAYKAIHDSTLLDSDIPRHRIGVLVSQNAGEFGSTTADLTIYTAAKTIADTIRQSCDLSPDQSDSLEQTIRTGHLEIDDTTLLGRLNCAAAGFICNKYGFNGPSFSVTSACASSLTALYNAVHLMRTGVLDAAIIGGGEELLSQGSFLEFSALGALAGKGYSNESPSAYSRPFDSERSGMVLGEGGGMIVLERESVARKRGAPILAYITGVGASNNHLGMVESVAETQKIAISTSFEDAGYGPEQVDMVECHATGTHMGDREEVNALKQIYPPNSSVVLSSFKSQIGHTLGASGVSSLIRGICAMHAGTFPPTLNYHTPDPDIGLEEAGFHVCKEAEPWPQPLERARRFEVNAFGFGGANYVVQVENSTRDNSQAPHILTDTIAPSPSVGVAFFKTESNNQTFRIGAIDNKNKNSALEKILEPYKQNLAKLTFKQKKELTELGITVAEETGSLPLSLVFSGQGTHYPQMGKELYKTFPVIRHWMDTLAELADFDILHLLFNEDGSKLQNTEWQQPALFLLEYSIYKQLNEFGLQPTAMAGHSMGELTALCVAGCFTYEDGFKIINKRAQCMAKASKMDVDPGSMLAVNAPEDYLNQKIAENTNLFFTNFNSPRQTVIGGGTKELVNFKQILDSDGHWNVQLPVSMAFHSPIMRIIREELGDYIGDIRMQAPEIPVISNTTCQPYPNDPDEIKKIIVSHLESPVHWQNNVLSLVNDFGCRCFLEIGPQDTLCNLIHECTKNVQCISSCSAENEVQALRQSVSSLFVNGSITPATISTLSLQQKELTISREAVLNIIQQEVYSYALHGAERYLKPAIIKAIQQNIDPHFDRAALAEYMPENFTPGLVPDTPGAGNAGPVPENNAVLEQVIQIIMDATGYERDEIDAEMNVRDDLAIKSSRIPIIVDAAEKTFNITTTLEDFLSVQTVQDLANRVAELMEGDDFQVPAQKVSINKSISASTHNTPTFVSSSKYGINRLVYQEEKITVNKETSLQIAPDSRILLLSLDAENNLQQLNNTFRDSYRCEAVSLQIKKDHHQDGYIDFFNSEETLRVVEEISAEGPLTGIVLISDSQAEQNLSPLEIVSLVTSYFALFQHFLKSNKRKFCIHLHHNNSPVETDSLLGQSILGLLFTAAKEFKGLCLRRLAFRGKVDIPELLRTALNLSNPLIDLLIEDHQLYTYKAARHTLSGAEEPALTLAKDDVIVISGGGRGVTSYLARSLAPFGCRLILLGRTSLEPSLSQGDVPAEPGKKQQFISSYLEQTYDNLSPRELKAKRKAVLHNIEVLQTITELEQLGATTQYIPCDVSDKVQVAEVMDSIVKEHGKIDGVIHGAGIIKDSYIPIIKPAMFKEVLDVKLFGAINLLQAAENKGLRFVVALSSIAASGGSIGQANYCIANRAMSTYCRTFRDSHQSVQTKVFWLPPIEGTGMADTPEIKDILVQNLGGDIFLEVHEAAEIMLRELLCGLADDCWVVPLRAVLQSEILLSDPVDQNTHWFDLERLPMIDSIARLDLRTKTIHATRTLSSDRDQWLADHKPSKLLRHPIMSAIMAVEAFLESSRILFPHLQMNGLQNIKLLQMIECPLDTNTEIHLFCQGETTHSSLQTCNVELKRPRKSSADTQETFMDTYFMAQVLASTTRLSPEREKITVENAPPLLSHGKIAELYENYSQLKNRYQVIDSIITCHHDTIRGKMLYPDVNDFSEALPSIFQYPHYLLEALMQITFFFTSIRNNGDPRIMIPAAIDSVSFTRNCRAGEELLLNGQLNLEDATGTVWDVHGVDSNGFIIMEIKGLQMKWVD